MAIGKRDRLTSAAETPAASAGVADYGATAGADSSVWHHTQQYERSHDGGASNKVTAGPPPPSGGTSSLQGLSRTN